MAAPSGNTGFAGEFFTKWGPGAMAEKSIFVLDGKNRTLDCDPRNPDFYENPYRLYRQLHEACPVFFWKQYGHWCFAGWNDVNSLLRDRRFGRQILHRMSRKQLGWPEPEEHLRDFELSERYSLLALEPPEHTRLRTVVNRAFVSRQIEKLRPEMEELANSLIDGFMARGSAELLRDYATPIPLAIICGMLDIPTKEGPQLLDWSHKIVGMYKYGRTRKDEETANRAAREFSEFLRDLIRERRKNPAQDLLSHMITAPAGGKRLSDDELVSSAILLLNAGHEATVHQSGNAIKTILEFTKKPAELFGSDREAMDTILETLRFDAPLHMFTRHALEDVELESGISLKAGQEIGLLLGAANRDPGRFENADSFVPFRKNQQNVTFGAGIHFCIGGPLAKLELQVGLKTLFERLPEMKLAEQPEYSNSYHFHGLEKLMVSW